MSNPLLQALSGNIGGADPREFLTGAPPTQAQHRASGPPAIPKPSASIVDPAGRGPGTEKNENLSLWERMRNKVKEPGVREGMLAFSAAMAMADQKGMNFAQALSMGLAAGNEAKNSYLDKLKADTQAEEQAKLDAANTESLIDARDKGVLQQDRIIEQGDLRGEQNEKRLGLEKERLDHARDQASKDYQIASKRLGIAEEELQMGRAKLGVEGARLALQLEQDARAGKLNEANIKRLEALHEKQMQENDAYRQLFEEYKRDGIDGKRVTEGEAALRATLDLSGRGDDMMQILRMFAEQSQGN